MSPQDIGKFHVLVDDRNGHRMFNLVAKNPTEVKRMLRDYPQLLPALETIIGVAKILSKETNHDR